ncbi:hypothetical protein AAFX43_16605 [Morganella morganii]
MQNLMPPIDTTDHAFHDGDPTTGQLGTIVTAAWLNDVQGATRDIQAEIIAVLTKAGIQPNPQKQNQLAEAISQIIGSGGYATSGDLTLGLSKKIDKADIAQQLGNDTTKVPSLQLVTTELGKKASVADANSKLAKDKNGADIPDKEAFIGNLGFPELLDKKADADIFTSSPITKIFNSTKTHFIQLSNGGYFEVKRVSDDVATFQFNPQGVMTAGEIPISFVSGFNDIFIGQFGMFPHRAADLPKGWFAITGDRYPVNSGAGKKIKSLPASLKTDWNIVESGGMINLPDIKQPDGRVPFLRPVNGTSRLPGSVEMDCQQGMTGFFGGRDVKGANGWTSFFWGESGVFRSAKKTSGEGQSPQTQSAPAGEWSGVEFNSANQVRTGNENRSLNIGFTLAIYLGA